MLKSKRNKEINKAVDKSKDYTLEEAIKILKEQSKVKFVETLDCAIRLGVDTQACRSNGKRNSVTSSWNRKASKSSGYCQRLKDSGSFGCRCRFCRF